MLSFHTEVSFYIFAGKKKERFYIQEEHVFFNKNNRNKKYCSEVKHLCAVFFKEKSEKIKLFFHQHSNYL